MFRIAINPHIGTGIRVPDIIERQLLRRPEERHPGIGYLLPQHVACCKIAVLARQPPMLDPLSLSSQWQGKGGDVSRGEQALCRLQVLVDHDATIVGQFNPADEVAHRLNSDTDDGQIDSDLPTALRHDATQAIATQKRRHLVTQEEFRSLGLVCRQEGGTDPGAEEAGERALLGGHNRDVDAALPQ